MKTRIFKIAALLAGLTIVVSGCVKTEPDIACTSTGACIETTRPVGNTFEGTMEQLVEVTVLDKEPTHLVRSTAGLGGQLVRAVVPILIGGVIQWQTALDVAGLAACAQPVLSEDGVNYGCNNTIIDVNGGNSQSVSGAAVNNVTDVDVGIDVGLGCTYCAAAD